MAGIVVYIVFYKYNNSMEKEQSLSRNKTKESISTKKWFNTLVLVLNIFTTCFCALALTPLLYFFSTSKVSTETVTAIFSIDWTIFGIFIAVASIMIAIKQTKKIRIVNRLIKTELIVLVINGLASSAMLFVTSLFIFIGNEKMYTAATFSTLYLLSLLFINCVFLLAILIFDEWVSREND